MRHCITIVRKHGSKKFDLLSGPDVPIPDQHRAFKILRSSPVDPTYAEAQLWTSDGGSRVAHFVTDEQAKLRAESLVKATEKANAAHAKAVAEAGKKNPAPVVLTRGQVRKLQLSKQAKREATHKAIQDKDARQFKVLTERQKSSAT